MSEPHKIFYKIYELENSLTNQDEGPKIKILWGFTVNTLSKHFLIRESLRPFLNSFTSREK